MQQANLVTLATLTKLVTLATFFLLGAYKVIVLLVAGHWKTKFYFFLHIQYIRMSN